MRRLKFLLLLFSLLFVAPCFAQQGKNGALVITTQPVVINEYTSLTADAGAGSSFIKVSNSALNTNNRFLQPLSAGDLIMIIQMQGATINGAPKDDTWGAITNYNNCGLYEFSVVADVPDSLTINIDCALKDNYTAMGKVQVVRIPRLTSLTIDTLGVLTCDAWNGASGGLVAAEVQNNIIINTGGSINATGLGFRGGALINMAEILGITTFDTTAQLGGEKGEGIAGDTSDYTPYGGMYCRGAPANGGGGGNADNASGGGGANAGNIANWTGNGNPDTSNAGWITAWNLEYNGFAYSTSSGGGRGGYSLTSAVANPLVYGPGNPAWDTWDHRSNVGGKGGRPLDYSTGRIFMGGGGGAGHENNDHGGAAGNGGGMVYILSYGTISGSGTIVSNGSNGGKSTGEYLVNGDGTGGGGGGGTIILNSTGAISGISVTANGGTGGKQVLPSSPESEGPGGGGGGGYIAISNGSINCEASGGSNGTTNSTTMVTFTPNGATRGGGGLANETISSVPFSSVIANAGANVSLCSGTNTELSASGGTSYLWNPSTSLSCDTCSNPVASPSVTTTYLVTVSSGSCSGTDSVVVSVSNSAIAGIISADKDTICQGAFVGLALTGSLGTIHWQYSVAGNNFVDISGADSVVYLTQANQSTYFRVFADTGTCSDTSASFLLTVNSLPVPPVLSTSDPSICSYDSTRINSSGAYASYGWSTGDTASYIYTSNSGSYWLTVSNSSGCSAVSDTQNIVVFPPVIAPTPTTPDSLICSSDSARISTSGAYSSYLWNTGDTTSYIYTSNAGPYWLTVTDANGCSAVSNHQNIAVYAVSSVSIIVQGDTLASFNAVAYQWYLNDTLIPGATAPVYVARQPGDYSVGVTDTNGCSENSSQININSVSAAVKDISSALDLNIYPNPSAIGDWQLAVSDELVGSYAEIYDAEGRLVWKSEIRNQKSEIKLNVEPGIYFLRIRNGGMSYLKKLVKE